VCTSSTRPGSPVDGQHIYETNTDKTLSWDGTAWNPVSGAAAYQAGAPSNPSVGSLWVDSDETASQLNTNDFLLKADASASTGYVSKVGGDTVVASGAAVKPLVLKGASSQTANLQEWQDSTGAVVASVSPTGNVAGSGLTLIKTQAIENQIGRKKNHVSVYESRLIDIDIIYFDDLVYSSEKIIVPHVKLYERKFVLEPMKEIAMDFVDPKLNLSIMELLEKCLDNSVLVKTIKSLKLKITQ
jgi:hypothetical protein